MNSIQSSVLPVFILTVFWTGTCFELIVQPKHINPGTTKSLHINCTLPSIKLAGLLFLNSLTLFKSTDGDSHASLLASVNFLKAYEQFFDEDGGKSSGIINNKGASYLSLQWLFPNFQITGEYLCEAFGMGPSMKPTTLTARATLYGENISMNGLSNEIRHLQIAEFQKDTKIKQLEIDLTEKEREINILQGNVTTLQTKYIDTFLKIERSLETLFYSSSIFEGNRYYLTKQLVIFTPTSAQATCEIYGGYLAEIDSDYEFNFVRNFLSHFNQFMGVWISGSDENIEGHWVGSRTKTAMKYIKWYNGEPGGGRKENCLCFWRDINWQVGDLKCSHIGLEMNYSYLCEIPVY